ncbi:hypothetical protein B0J12DRAFT_735464 [Macrophomina phaseolina]|uniref:Rhodopsin domain-containing protein n=1 Tax=Macrophomina phaseolina TaxID=35725 RepID=A0ABQ8GSV6_9PEZI|nr:hypothetical protein B0J12DRAFT_735464 [Macrophomina phaseolina]
MPGGPVPPIELLMQWQTDAFPHGIRSGPTITVISAVFTAIALVVVLARLHDRLVTRHNYGLDDTLIVMAMITTIGLAVATSLAEQYYGFNRHTWDLTAEIAPSTRKITLSISVLYLASTGFTKLSILCFYRRIGEIRPWFKWTIWLNMAFVIAYSLSFTIVIFFECSPVDAYWNKANPHWRLSHKFHCINEGAKMVTAGAISAAQDVLACILPMALFWDLRISKRAKLALGFVFSLGLLTSAVSIVRTIKIYRIFFETYDVTWAARIVFSFTIVEACLGIICASMPALKNSLQRVFHIVIDPFTIGSSKTNRRWKNPFFRTYQRSFKDYFSSSQPTSNPSRTSGRVVNKGPVTPQNTYDSYQSQSLKASESRSIEERELNTIQEGHYLNV